MKKNLSLITIFVVFLIFLATLIYFSRSIEGKNRTPLNIYTPCGLTAPFQELGLAFEKTYRNTKVEITSDNAVILTKLIREKGKKPDLFVSPGEKEIGLLRQDGLIDEHSIKSFGRHELILIVPADSKDINSLEDLFKDTVKIIAIANPNYNSIGDYSVIALMKLGYWDKLKKTKSIIFTDTPIEALASVAAKKSDAGIHYNFCSFEPNSGKVAQGGIRVVAQLPSLSHPPIYNYVGILNASKNSKIAQSFINFMSSFKGQKILSKYGLAGNVKQVNQVLPGTR